MRRSFVRSVAEMRTLFPATLVAPDDALLQPFPPPVHWPTHANVCVFRRVTPNVPATPTSPPLAPATIAMIESWAFAVTDTSFIAFTHAPSSMYASVLSVTTCTPTPTPTPTVPATAIVAAIESSWYWLPAATRTDWSGSAPATFVAHVG